MPHGGYHGTVKMGGKTIQQGYQDNSGNYQIRGGIDDNSRLDKNPPRNIQPAQLPNIPDNLITNEMRLQNIVDNKDIFKNQPSPTRPGMNIYQDRMQDFRTSTPEAMQTYADRFPLTQMAMTGLPLIAKSMIPFGNVFSAIADSYRYGSSKVQGSARSFGNNLAGEFSGTVDGIKSLFTKDSSAPEEFVVRKNQSAPLRDRFDEKKLNTSVDTNEDIFKLPYDLTGSYATATNINPNIIRETKGNYLVNNPTFGLQMIKRAGGGLASINNPDYQRLMGASNFSF